MSYAAIFFVLLFTAGMAGLCVYLFMQLRAARNKSAGLEQRVRSYEERAHPGQLKTIEARLNPHLFKNILNSIQSHAYQTYFAIDKLGNVLDYILYESSNPFVTPKEEIAFALNLVEINKVKLSPLFELKVKTQLDESDPLYQQKIIAPLISVDLIENAFKHADLQSPDSFISIVVEFANGSFVLTVSNKISPKAALKKPYAGIGNETLEQRLSIIYNNRFKLERFTEEDVYIARLKIQLIESPDKMPVA